MYNGVKCYFTFTVLPFGLHSSPYVFTKCVKPLVAHWRALGLKIVVYLDDGICAVKNLDEGRRAANIVKSDLLRAGLVPNVEKSVWEPTVELKWLGILWNFKEGILKIPDEKLCNLKNTLHIVISKLTSISAIELARLTGLIISFTPCIGNITRLMTRFLYSEIDKASTWDVRLNLGNNCDIVRELNFWLENIDSFNGTKKFRDITLPKDILGYSDASSFAAGGYIVHSTINFAQEWCHKTWTNEEREKSSTWREMRACWFALASYSKFLKGKQVKWFSDNKNLVSIIEKGSKKLDLQTIALDIYQLQVLFDIKLEVEWIPREENQLADYISKIHDYDDWEVSDDFFYFMDGLFGPVTVDRFASLNTRKTSRYNSKFWDPYCEAVDAFTQNWSSENDWLVPPIYLISRCIRHLKGCKGQGTLIAPEWKSSSFWADLVEFGGVFKSGVLDVLRFPRSNCNIFKSGLHTSVFGTSKLHSAILAIRLDFS
ncbi:hypothetical protein FSP39_015112 [Pinctada imbricata]|uniref:Reverse transcriptase domain-containing protein n=1 Tax=Pinctada imbricata TaxID=66713 RepID=A0AA88XWU4_PINIB|nr:hypothetical protein FSP39_015112 [Pinctada imbricata]